MMLRIPRAAPGLTCFAASRLWDRMGLVMLDPPYDSPVDGKRSIESRRVWRAYEPHRSSRRKLVRLTSFATPYLAPPHIGARPSSVSPNSTKNSIAASRSAQQCRRVETFDGHA